MVTVSVCVIGICVVTISNVLRPAVEVEMNTAVELVALLELVATLELIAMLELVTVLEIFGAASDVSGRREPRMALACSVSTQERTTPLAVVMGIA